MAAQPEPAHDPYRLTSDQQHLFNRAMWLVLGIGIGWFLFGSGNYPENIFVSILNVAATYFVLDYWVSQRDERRKIEDLKNQLLRQVRSSENVIAKHAVHELREYGWLTRKNGLLSNHYMGFANLEGALLTGAQMQGASFLYANLKGADLAMADLTGADLTCANLEGANLYPDTNLQRAILKGTKLAEAYLVEVNLAGADLEYVQFDRPNLEYADLRGANLRSVHLEHARLSNAKLQGANLEFANLRGADLVGASLQGASLRQATFDEMTVLPNAEWDEKKKEAVFHYWTPDTDMSRYTDPNHPNFWQPDWVKKQQQE